MSMTPQEARRAALAAARAWKPIQPVKPAPATKPTKPAPAATTVTEPKPGITRVGPDLAARAESLAQSRADQQTVLGTIRSQPRGDMTDSGPLEAALEKAEREKEIWVRIASGAIEDLIASGNEFSADDVRAAMPEGLEPHHPNAWGALFNSYKREKLIELAGYRQSTTKSRNGGVLRMWRAAPARDDS